MLHNANLKKIYDVLAIAASHGGIQKLVIYKLIIHAIYVVSKIFLTHYFTPHMFKSIKWKLLSISA